MIEAEIDVMAGHNGELMLDAFGYQPATASRVVGLGGNAPGHDPTYVFHTSYVEVAPGPAHFAVKFYGLRAKRGTITLRVHMLRMEEGAHATLVNSERIRVNRLVARDGYAQMRFEGFKGMSFAFVATITEDSDASAELVAVSLDRPANPEQEDDIVIEADSTAYGTKSIRPSAHLLAVEPPRFAEPASQAATMGQMNERAFRDALRAIGPIGGTAAEEWQAAYVYQALKRYGMIQAGARGVGFGVERSPLPTALAAEDIMVLAADAARPLLSDDSAVPATLTRPASGDPAPVVRNVTHRDIWIDPIPRDIVNFDFLWSIGATEQPGTIAGGLAFVEASMNCLRPGGLAVHVLSFDPEGAGQVTDGGRMPPFVRPDIERLALNLVSRGHEVAQVRIDDPFSRSRKAAMLPVFGLIARKAAQSF